MTLTVEPQSYRIETQTGTVGDLITIPYHSKGISIRPLTPFSQSVAVSYLVPNEEKSSGPGEGNEFSIEERVYGLGEHNDVELPFYATGTTVFSPLDDESTFVYFLG
ncbi:hypothetical protein HTZ84_09685 [Haloterrigena sp. SYSU A558-1]|uniref:Uncharacterized protein n=1 Tax=Haloterrigena gelatinilytica TaxID=2741724 RepID=A0ABX2LFF4_9EURY|nr:hypothetical protein [Haloterrigena gelatinilytica]NUC72576.1 hypothetical protein [Haloterrigena gelatinilytica]